MGIEIFRIQPLARFAGQNAGIRRPKEFAYFSFDDEHKFRLDDSSLRYYYPPALPVDLSRGFDTFKKLDDGGDDHLDALLQTVAAHEVAIGSKMETDVLTWRGMMTKIMAAPFDNMNGFEMNATCFQGTIFIEENHAYKLGSRDDQHAQRPMPGAASQELMSFWGYKFETLSLLSKPWDPSSRVEIESREDQIVNNHAQYCSVVRTGLGKVKMILGGEVDAIWDTRPDDKNEPIHWVELKTTAEIESDRDYTKFERKLLKFWIQSFLLGVPKIIVGYRTKDGILSRIEELETQSIPDRVKNQGRHMWDGNVCINFTANFLEWLKTVIIGDGVWRIRKPEKASLIEVFKLEDTGHGDILPEDFVNRRNKM